MVLTVRVVEMGSRHTRRRFLGVTAGLSVSVTAAGCGMFDDDDKTPEKPDPLQPLLLEAVTLAAAFDQAALAQPGLATRLTPLAGDHRAHAVELAKVIGKPVPSPVPTAASSGPVAGSDAAALLKALRARISAGQRNAVAACRQAPPDRVALVGSIAACRATHAEALR
jgi:hypothetical protein